MPGLLDVAPSMKTVTVCGTEVAVTGVSAKGVAVIMSRFPMVRELMTGRAPQGLTAESLVQLVPDAIACVIAAGTGAPGDAKAEAIAATLPVGDQLELLDSIIKATLPQGTGPFVEKLTAFASVVGVEPISIPVTNSPQPSNS